MQSKASRIHDVGARQPIPTQPTRPNSTHCTLVVSQLMSNLTVILANQMRVELKLSILTTNLSLFYNMNLIIIESNRQFYRSNVSFEGFTKGLQRLQRLQRHSLRCQTTKSVHRQ